MLDFDLAESYQIETRVLKQAVRRNMERFDGEDFMFELSEDMRRELDNIYMAIAALSAKPQQTTPPRKPIGYRTDTAKEQ